MIRAIDGRRGALVALALCAQLAFAQTGGPAPAPTLDPAAAARIAALDCERIAERDVRDTLAAAAAPRLILLHGSVAIFNMESFAEFLAAMGYPEERIRNPRDGATSYSSAGSSEALAGTLAWYYEREGMVPLLIGHSQGGMLAVRTLHELAGAFAESIPVFDPLTGQAEARTTFVDPATGRQRPVLGLQVPYATAIATGRLPRLLLGQWSMLGKLRQIPDTAIDFTGFSIGFDLIAGEFGGADPYAATGTARVRNVVLPAGYAHIALPQTRHLSANEQTRAWVDAYKPGMDTSTLPQGADVDTNNIVHAADIWYSVKREWCLQAQRQARAQPREGAR